MFYKLISTLFFIGYFPFAPGTVASAIAMIILFIFKPSTFSLFFIWISAIILGVICSEKMERQTNAKDASYIVIDEFTGYLTAVLLVPLTIQNLLLAFIFFRFFDIIKPPPIRQIEKRVEGGLGIMIDDIIAGIMSNVLLRVLLVLL